MAARADGLAKQFEAKVQEATAVLDRLSEADWNKTTSAEKWPVGVVAHHLAGAHEPIAGIIKAVASGHAVLNVVPLPVNVTAVLLRASGPPVTVARTVWGPGNGFASPHCSTRTLDPGDAD